MTSYPYTSPNYPGADIAAIQVGSPAERAGLKSGMVVHAADGAPLADILDWYWLTDDLEIELKVSSTDSAGRADAKQSSSPESPSALKSVLLTRKPGESWGIEFTSVIFDGLRSCKNNCCFCFMKMLPEGMRPALYVRDDDYRLSFLQGNFVTLTNLSDDDVERIICMHLSPLNLSLHAVDESVRAQLMGKNHARGLEVAERLMRAGIEFKVQIVLLPGINDGSVLDETLAWIEEHPGILVTGIVPYGYTRFAAVQGGFDTPESARAVIQQVAHLAPQVQLADEFYIMAWPGEILAHLPERQYYQDYPLLADGIGMVRNLVDALREPGSDLATALYVQELGSLEAGATVLITGEAFAAVLHELLPGCQERVVAVRNEYFGGNVDVAGLLTAEDIVAQVQTWMGEQVKVREPSEQTPVEAQSIAGSDQAKAPHATVQTPEMPKHYLLPSVLFNDDGLTLDNKTAVDIAEALGVSVKVLDFM